MSEKYYITTAIDYPNGNPHIGHAYEKVVTDFYARYYRQKGAEVFFLTGTDENGQKLKEGAEKVGKPVQEFVDSNAEIFKNFCQKLNISHDDFIRTTEKRHHDGAHEIWKKVLKKGLIYKGDYSGHYCIDCESFYTQSQLVNENQCPNHFKELPIRKEEGYFFKLSDFQDWLIDHIENNPEFISPKAARSELLSRLKKEPLRDLSISRPNEGWGIAIPDDEQFVMYTWFDALINYYSGLSDKEKWWPASAHVIGRDIIWFHCVIWPSILKASDLELPGKVYVHGMVLGEDGKKMSKSLGNGVDPQEVLEKFEVETFRFYLLKSIPAQSDGRFSMDELKEAHNNTLANDFGNQIMRVLKMAIKKTGDQLKFESNFKMDFDLEALNKAFGQHVKNYEHHKALEVLWAEVQRVNQYINEREPWKIKEVNDELRNILVNCTIAIHCFTHLLTPVMPKTCEKILSYLGIENSVNPFSDYQNITYNFQMPEILFNKID